MPEALYFSRSVTDNAPGREGAQFAPPEPLPEGWPLTLGQLCSAPEPLMSHPALQPVIAAVHRKWPELFPNMGALRNLPAPRWKASADSGRVVRLSAEGRVEGWFNVQPRSGCLQPGEPGPEAVGGLAAWRWVGVVQMAKPRHRWTAADIAAYAAAEPAQRTGAVPREHRLLGPWLRADHQQLQHQPLPPPPLAAYPPAWGHGKVALHVFKVANARKRLTLAATAAAEPAYKVGEGLRPPLWPADDEGGGAGPADEAGLSPPERAWVQHARAERDRTASQRASDAPWMHPAPARPSPDERAAARAARAHQAADLAAGPGMAPDGPSAPDPGSPSDQQPMGPAARPPEMDPMPGPRAQATAATAVWRRLWACPADNHVKVLGWRLLHAALPCNAYGASRRERIQPCCTASTCAAQGRRRSTDETYVHLFLQCPEVSRAVGWLRDLWQAIAGHRPPNDPAVLLGDMAARWPEYPATEPMQQLWTCLRLTLLYHIWRLRCQRRVGRSGAVEAVRATIATLRETMQQLFYRTARSVDMFDHLPARLMGGSIRQRDLGGFLGMWCHGGVLAMVMADPITGRPQLTVRLSDVHPIPAPGEELEDGP